MAEVSTRISLASAFDAQAGYLVLEADTERGPGWFRCYASGEVRFATSAGRVSVHGTAYQELAEEIPFPGREAQASHPVGARRFHWLGRDGGALQIAPSGALQRAVDTGPAMLRLQYLAPYRLCHVDLPYPVLIVATMGDAQASLTLTPAEEDYAADWQGDDFSDDPWDSDAAAQSLTVRLVNCYTGDDITVPDAAAATIQVGSAIARLSGGSSATLSRVPPGTLAVSVRGVPGYLDTDQDSLSNDRVVLSHGDA